MHYTEGSMCLKITNFLISFSKYLFDVDARAEKYMDVTQNASIDFCKSFWQSSETKFMKMMPSILSRRVDVSHHFEIETKPMKIFSKKFGREVDVPLPQSHTEIRPIPVRLISSRRRGRMIGQESSTNELSDCLIIHVSIIILSERKFLNFDSSQHFSTVAWRWLDMPKSEIT